MSWRGDIAMGKYGKLPCALIDNNMFPGVEVDCGSFVVACPCCGRWSPFRVLEQAIQTESAAGQTEEAKGGMHLC